MVYNHTELKTAMSEIKQINTGVAEIIAVKVDSEDYDFKLNHDCSGILSQNDESESPFPHVYWLPKGKWQILGIDTELTEEQCREVMPEAEIISEIDNGCSIKEEYGFLDYTNDDNSFNTAKEAFASLMQANGINEPHLILKRLS